jgi:hypothetical protein
VLQYLAKNNSNKIIQRFSDEDTKKDYELSYILFLCMELEIDFLKRSVRGQQNPTLIFGRESKYEMKM